MCLNEFSQFQTVQIGQYSTHLHIGSITCVRYIFTQIVVSSYANLCIYEVQEVGFSVSLSATRTLLDILTVITTKSTHC